jgi:hypothetical protein
MAPQLACEPFTTVDDVLESSCACDLNDQDHGLYIEELIDDASDMLYIISGGRVSGRCQRTVWPIKVCTVMPEGMPERESWIAWDSIDTIPLQGPNTEIIEITIDGIALNPSEYGLLEGNKLFRRVGDWPRYNDVTLTDADVGTFTITYKFGPLITHVARRACNELVCQMVKEEPRALSRLRGVVSANVQGVSVQYDDDEVRALGLPEVTRFVDTFASSGPRPVGVYSPELMHGWHLVSVEGPSGS